MLQFPLWKKIMIGVICALGLIYAMPNLAPSAFKDLPSWAPSKTVNLGLDLQGGAHLLMQVGTEAVIRERMQSTEESIRVSLREARVRARGLGVEGGAVTFRLSDPTKTDEVRTLLREIDDEMTIESQDNGTFRLSLSETAQTELLNNAIEQSIEIVRRRVDEFGTTEPTIQRQGDSRILVQVPGIGDTARLKEVLNTTAKLSFHLVDRTKSVEEALQGRVPPGLDLRPSRETTPDGQPMQYYLVERRVIVSGESLTNAQSTFQNGQAVVSFSFDTRGAKRFGDATRENVNELLAIVLDQEVVSAPRINEPILGGSGVISGSFTLQETEDLSILLRAGALPAPLTYIEERSVGPGLGQDSIDAGKLAAMIGFLAVAVFMASSYGLFGVMTVVALVINLALILAILSALQATLTLPGIAGIVLTVGMAVDANVLIFERIREEARSGRNPISAADAGYRSALSTIIDANVTTLIAAILLFAFGSGPIRGFAVTLSVGILTSMFTAIMITRLFVATWLRSRRPDKLPI
jgi:preprotein translocase subunit SecD